MATRTVNLLVKKTMQILNNGYFTNACLCPISSYQSNDQNVDPFPFTFSNSLIVHEVLIIHKIVSQFCALIWVTWMAVATRVKNRSKHMNISRSKYTC